MMPTHKQVRLLRHPNDEALALAAAEAWLGLIAVAHKSDRMHTVALSGGRTMRKFFTAALEGAARRELDFKHVQFFWADERCLPPDDPESNFRLAHDILLGPAGVPSENIHRIDGEAPPESAAMEAGRALVHSCQVPGSAVPVLDLVLLGMGEDGHVASLFPDRPTTETDLGSSFLPVFDSPKPPPHRVSLGHGPIAAARAVWVLASGTGKRAALQDSLTTISTTPLAKVIHGRESTTIYTDLHAMRHGPK